MTSTTSFREFMQEWKALYGWNLRRSRGISLLYFGLLLLAGPVLTFLVCSVSSYPQNTLSSIVPVNSGLSLPLTMIFTLVLAIQRFSYMHNKRSIDLYHAMPVRRTPMLLASWSASLTGLLLPLLADVLLLFFTNVWFSQGAWYNIPLKDFVFLFGSQMFMAAVCLTFCMLMAVCSGTVMDMVISIVLTNCSYPLVIFMVMLLGSWLLPGFNGSYSLTLITALAPFPAMIVSMLFAGDYIGPLFGYDNVVDNPWVFWIWWICLLVAMLISSLWLYSRRKSESAESDLAFPAPKILLRFLCSAAVGLLAGMVFFIIVNTTTSFFIGFILFSLMAHAVTEALYSRGLRRFVKTLPAYGAMVLCVTVLYLCAATGFFGYDTWMPQNIKSASIATSWYQEGINPSWSCSSNPIYLFTESKGEIARRDRMVFTEAQHIETIQEIQKNLINSRKPEGSPFYSFIANGTHTTFTYDTPSGTVTRNISSSMNDFDEKAYALLKNLQNTQEWKNQTMPYVIDSKGVDSIWIRANKGLDSLAGLNESGGDIISPDIEYSEEYLESNSIQCEPTQEEIEKLLSFLKKDIEAGAFLKTENTFNEEFLYLDIDISRYFRLTEDSPWYELAPEYKGQIVQQRYQYGSTEFIISPEADTYAYLLELAEKYGEATAQ